MQQLLTFLAKPLYVGIISFLLSLTLVVDDLDPREYVSSIPILFLFFSLPFIIISQFTKRQLRKPNNQNRLVGLWLGSVGAALLWTISIIFSNNEQAGLGFMWWGSIALSGGVIGHLLGWFLSD